MQITDGSIPSLMIDHEAEDSVEREAEVIDSARYDRPQTVSHNR
jgi:hypothetical protein